MLFEGPEKKLEILLTAGSSSLRELGREFWEHVVERSQATILSSISNDRLDAYLLSESSLFVTDRWTVMITCGRTTLVAAAAAILDGLPNVRLDSLIYERKNENFPHLQRTTFRDDVTELRQRVAGDDLVIGDPAGDHIAIFHLDRNCYPEPDDTTLEVLMYDIDPAVSRRFVPGRGTVEDVRKLVGLSSLFPDFAVDDHIFAPQGYSFNAIKGEDYVTLHVTPQRIGSYVSFETNVRLGVAAQRRVVSGLLSRFLPARCDLLLFGAPLDAAAAPAGFRVTHASDQMLACGYSIAYAHVERLPTGSR
jgi:S-adenosylmethionine decarboxylase